MVETGIKILLVKEMQLIDLDLLLGILVDNKVVAVGIDLSKQLYLITIPDLHPFFFSEVTVTVLLG